MNELVIRFGWLTGRGPGLVWRWRGSAASSC